MTHKKMLAIMGVHWFVSVVCAIISLLLCFNGIFDGKWRFQILLCLVLDILILISAIGTYLYFFTTVRKIKRMVENATGQPHESSVELLMKNFKLPCYIVMTYIIFNLSSTVILASAAHTKIKARWQLLINISQFLVIWGFASDVCIYVFADRKVRKLLASKFKRSNVQGSNRISDKNL